MDYDVDNIPYAEIEKRAREQRAQVMKAGLIAMKNAVKSVFSGLYTSGHKTA